jgi:hypothetical protein
MLHSGASLLLYEGEHICLGHVAEAVRLMNGVTIWPDENLVNTHSAKIRVSFRVCNGLRCSGSYVPALGPSSPASGMAIAGMSGEWIVSGEGTEVR